MKTHDSVDLHDRPWFRRLSMTHKAIVHYIKAMADHAGVWNVDKKLAAIYLLGDDSEQLGASIDWKAFEEAMGNNLASFSEGQFWFLPWYIPLHNQEFTPAELIESVDAAYAAKTKTNNFHVRIVKDLKRWQRMGLEIATSKPTQAPPKGLPAPLEGVITEEKRGIASPGKGERGEPSVPSSSASPVADNCRAARPNGSAADHSETRRETLQASRPTTDSPHNSHADRIATILWDKGVFVWRGMLACMGEPNADTREPHRLEIEPVMTALTFGNKPFTELELLGAARVTWRAWKDRPELAQCFNPRTVFNLEKLLPRVSAARRAGLIGDRKVKATEEAIALRDVPGPSDEERKVVADGFREFNKKTFGQKAA